MIGWQRKRFREHWARLSRQGQRGRPPVAQEIRELIRKMSAANPTWGSPRIMAELGKLGIEVAKSTVERYRLRRSKPPSPTWRTFLATHAKDLVSVDFFTVATVRRFAPHTVHGHGEFPIGPLSAELANHLDRARMSIIRGTPGSHAGHADLGVAPTGPVDGDHGLLGRIVEIEDHLTHEDTSQPLFRPRVRARRVPRRG